MNGKKWIRTWFIIIIIITPTAGVFNYLIDPYGLNSNKNKFDDHLTSINKPNITKLKINLQADYYLIGTSRVKRVNPVIIENYFLDKQVYNINISGATFRENSMLAHKVIGNGNNIIYGFDAFSLNKNRLKQDKLNVLTNRYETYQKKIESNTIYSEFLSFDFLIMSMKDVVKRFLGVNLNQFTISENTRDYNTTLENVEEKLDLSRQEKVGPYTNFETVSEIDIIKLAKIATKDDIFIIYPKYFYYYKSFQKYQNIEEQYFTAIKTLVKNTEAKVWSFYQINSITTNEKNFDNNAWHFKPKIANLVFGKIYNDTSMTIPNNFGVLLTKDNIDEHLENLKEQIKKYDLDKTKHQHKYNSND